ncbi:MAG: hypothetical protein IJC32_00990 [Clostridia bacterium]|nr:hypothetical protein [Clostridia bacterium]
MTTLENLYYGNIQPNEGTARNIDRSRNLERLSSRNEEELESTLTDKQKETFEKYKDCNRELLGGTEVNAFVDGFTIAMKIMVEIGSVNYNTE